MVFEKVYEENSITSLWVLVVQKENPSKLNWMDNFLLEVTSIFLFIVFFFTICFVIRWRPITT